MKPRIILSIVLCLSLSTYAKSPSGIYLTPADFEHNKLSYESSPKQKQHIQLRDFFWDRPIVIIKAGHKKYILKKSAIYGFRDHNNTVYRFYKNAAYRIAEAGPIYIYDHKENSTQGKGFKVISHTFFSVGAGTPIYALTLDNLEMAYGNNKRFTDLLFRYCHDENASAYDDTHHTYKINYLYAEASREESK